MTQEELEHKKNELKTEIDIAKQLLNENIKDFQITEYLSTKDDVKSIDTPKTTIVENTEIKETKSTD